MTLVISRLLSPLVESGPFTAWLSDPSSIPGSRPRSAKAPTHIYGDIGRPLGNWRDRADRTHDFDPRRP